MENKIEPSSISGQAGRYLCFSLGREKFAMPLLQVKEVIANTETTSIPQSPSYFKGIMNLRGQVISVIDLRSKLKIGKAESTAETTIVILDVEGLFLGVVVDSVNAVTEFTDAMISETPVRDTTMNIGYITGVARDEESLTLILDLKMILNIEDMNALRTAQKAA